MNNMYKNILSFFAGICLMILTSANTGVIEFKPENPKFIAMDYFYNFNKAKSFVITKSKDGFILKTTSTDGNGMIIIIMEKY